MRRQELAVLRIDGDGQVIGVWPTTELQAALDRSLCVPEFLLKDPGDASDDEPFGFPFPFDSLLLKPPLVLVSLFLKLTLVLVPPIVRFTSGAPSKPATDEARHGADDDPEKRSEQRDQRRVDRLRVRQQAGYERAQKSIVSL